MKSRFFISILFAIQQFAPMTKSTQNWSVNHFYQHNFVLGPNFWSHWVKTAVSSSLVRSSHNKNKNSTFLLGSKVYWFIPSKVTKRLKTDEKWHCQTGWMPSSCSHGNSSTSSRPKWFLAFLPTSRPVGDASSRRMGV